MRTKSQSSSYSTLIVMLTTLFSRLLGFVRSATVGAFFGQSWKADVLNAVFTIPFNLRKLLAEGALSSAFIPILAHAQVLDPSKRKSIELTRAILTFQILVLVPFIALCIVFSQPLISLIIPFAEAEKQVLAVDLFRWFINYLFFVSINAVLMAVLNLHHEFAIPAISPILFSLSVIFSLIVFFPGMDIYAKVPGVLLGGIAQFVFQYFAFRRLGYSIKPLRRFWTKELKLVIKNWAPSISISGIALLNQQIAIGLAATLPEGSVSALSNAIVFWQLPIGVLSASVITVCFPRLSSQIAQKDWNLAANTLMQGLKLQALLLIPAGFFLGYLSEPLIALAYQRQRFTHQDTLTTAGVLSILAWGLFTSATFNFLQRFFFAKNQFFFPFLANLVWAVTDLIFSLILMRTSLGVQGLAWGAVMGFASGAILLMILAWSSLPKQTLWDFLGFSLRVSLALIPSWLVLNSFSSQLGPSFWKSGLTFFTLGIFFLEALLGMTLFAIFLLLLGIHPWRFFNRKTGYFR